MSRKGRMFLTVVVLLGSLLSGLPASPALAAPLSTCEDGPQASGAIYRICMPEPGRWNGDLVVYAHGYVAFNEPVGIPENQLVLPDGTSLPEIINGLGFAFATTSYSTNGLAVREGIEDVRDVVDVFRARYGEPGHVYLGGASEGGLVTALAVERFPAVFDGGLSTCGPVGSFRGQINYWGDLRVVFDVFFPGLIPGNALDIPQEVIDQWDTVYKPAVVAALRANPDAMAQLLRVADVPVERDNPASAEEALLQLLWYNVFGSNDGIAKLGGQPFGNMLRVYHGSENDLALNRQVQRFRADPAALEEIAAHYQTSGQLASPLVTLHTTGDPYVPYWHELYYAGAVQSSGSSPLHTNIPVFRYGHCNFKVSEVLAAFALLVLKVTGQELHGVEQVLPDADSQAEFLRLAREVGALR
ncbi:MAG: hypothetical protein QHJ81_12005 [Anaerolineae bacterium]|nr:hypothetical protein [Anaerolineae bacterium]